MPNQGFRRSFRTPRGYLQDPGGRIALFNQVYVGYVKNNDDAFSMGRLQVWIPEFSNSPDDENSWFTVQYCSPMAGATNVKSNTKEGKELADTQQSYGWWAVPPDLENQVVVMFINGDPNKGIYIGGMYQQFMNHMVPGIPAGTSHQEGVGGNQPPVGEYNKWDPNIPNSDNHVRARFEPLHEGLKAQGLYEDSSRGPSDAGARRDPVSKVYGFKSPSGSHLVFDDADGDSYIRIRTASGAQVLINDTVGYIYMISGNGNSWMELSDDGIDAYSSQSISMRSQGDLNFHADGAINLHAGKAFNVFSPASATLQFGGDLNIIGKNAIKLNSPSVSIAGAKTVAIKGGNVGIGATATVAVNAKTITTNMAPGPQVSDATGLNTSRHPDRALDASAGYPSGSMESITSRLPTHEPFSGHPGTKTTASSGSGGVGYDEVSAEGAGDEVDDSQPVLVPDDGTKFAVPVNGTCGSPFGYRIHPIKKRHIMHTGVDFRGTPSGTPIYASKGGMVIFAGNKSGYGNVVIIDHGNGMSTFYAHQSQLLVRKGQQVKQMSQIGRVGSTGLSTGPHLHFEVRKNGVPINPAQVIPFNRNQRSRAGSTK